ncbi:hypothetical protein DD715_09455 [Bifidobacterium bifidum]|uniref:hypothetical protein n=1 Tax=Bifidobacterium bifidum TaxID=1681 RepID=UPI000D57A079|nr:hypothetical protein DD715_09455 [Bifidobacterium bifidum]
MGAPPIHSFAGCQSNRRTTESTKTHRPSNKTRQIHGQDEDRENAVNEDRESIKRADPHDAAIMTEAQHIGFFKQTATPPDADLISRAILQPQYPQRRAPSMPQMTRPPMQMMS